MKAIQITVVLVSSIIIAACSTAKKTTTTAVSPSPASTDNFVFAKAPDGIYVPGNEELTAIRVRYQDVTLDKLKEGHAIYTQGVCVKCHAAQNIYQLVEVRWKNIVEEMAQKAEISDAQKDAVYKYVLAIKATQPK